MKTNFGNYSINNQTECDLYIAIALIYFCQGFPFFYGWYEKIVKNGDA